MPWSEKIKVDALVACQRSCCVCHVFCGTKMELHHIVPEAKGGESTLENCIPLCFNCHAEVEHYNPAHPKGTKFSPEELKKHRDTWFKRVTETGSHPSAGNTDAIDERIAKEIHSYMASGERWDDGFIFLRDHDMGNSYHQRHTNGIMSLDDRFRFYLDFQFLDADLEARRAEFAESLHQAVYSIAGLTAPSDHNPEFFTTGLSEADWGTEHWKRGLAEIAKVNELNTKAAEAYEILFDLFRRRLSLDLRF